MSSPISTVAQTHDDAMSPQSSENENPSAATRVGSTAEMVEMIVRKLDWKKMFSSKRVSVLWNDTIERLLRQPEYCILGTVPVAPSKVYIYKRKGQSVIRDWSSTELDHSTDSGEWIAQYHPLLGKSRSINGEALLTWSSGIWENMFVTQPPCETVDISCVRFDQVHVKGGVTWKDVIKRIWILKRCHSMAGARFNWRSVSIEPVGVINKTSRRLERVAK